MDKVTLKFKMIISLTSLSFLLIITKMPRLPHETPTLTGQIVWAVLTGTALGWITRLGIEMFYSNIKRKKGF